MKVYVVFLIDSDDCTYSYDILHKIYANQNDAEVEETRINLIFLGKMEYPKWDYFPANPYNLSKEDLDIASYHAVRVEEVEVL